MESAPEPDGSGEEKRLELGTTRRYRTSELSWGAKGLEIEGSVSVTGAFFQRPLKMSTGSDLGLKDGIANTTGIRSGAQVCNFSDSVRSAKVQ